MEKRKRNLEGNEGRSLINEAIEEVGGRRFIKHRVEEEDLLDRGSWMKKIDGIEGDG